jgi:hypothetical protein
MGWFLFNFASWEPSVKKHIRKVRTLTDVFCIKVVSRVIKTGHYELNTLFIHKHYGLETFKFVYNVNISTWKEGNKDWTLGLCKMIS